MRCWSSEQLDDHPAKRDKQKTLLLVSSFEEDRTSLDRMLGKSEWMVDSARTCREAMVLMSEKPAAVVICERELLDGNWKDMLDALTLMKHHPALIVSSRLADEYLWVGVLNLGGYDVLAKPLNTKEVLRVINSAWRAWERQREQAEDSREPSREKEMIQMPASATEVSDLALQPEETNQTWPGQAVNRWFRLPYSVLVFLIFGVLVGVLYLGSLLD